MSSDIHETQAQLGDFEARRVDYETGIFYGVDVSACATLRDHAERKADQMGSLRGSIEDGDGNFAGLLAEFALESILDGERHATYDYDVYADVYGGRRIDAKTKRRTVAPKPYYEVSIAEWNTEQDCDWYYFTSYNTETDVLWLLGYMPPAEYYDRAEFHEEGDYDPDNDFTFKADCHNLPFAELRQPKALADAFGAAAMEVRVG